MVYVQQIYFAVCMNNTGICMANYSEFVSNQSKWTWLQVGLIKKQRDKTVCCVQCLPCNRVRSQKRRCRFGSLWERMLMKR